MHHDQSPWSGHLTLLLVYCLYEWPWDAIYPTCSCQSCGNITQLGRYCHAKASRILLDSQSWWHACLVISSVIFYLYLSLPLYLPTPFLHCIQSLLRLLSCSFIYLLKPSLSIYLNTSVNTNCGVPVPLSSSPPYLTMQFICSILSSKYLSYLVPQNQPKKWCKTFLSSNVLY